MKPISYITLQKKYGGKWVALTKDERKVLAAKETFDELHKYLEKKKIDTTEVVFSKIEKYGVVSVYILKNN